MPSDRELSGLELSNGCQARRCGAESEDSMTIWSLLNNPATTLVFMAAIGIAALLVGVRELILRGVPHVDQNVGEEE